MTTADELRLELEGLDYVEGGDSYYRGVATRAITALEALQKKVDELEEELVQVNMSEVFCPICNSCGEDGCCPRHKCHRNGEIQELRADLEKERRSRWIPVSERLPDESGMCLVTINGCSRESYFNQPTQEFSLIQPFGVGVTAWQPLPEPFDSGRGA